MINCLFRLTVASCSFACNSTAFLLQLYFGLYCEFSCISLFSNYFTVNSLKEFGKLLSSVEDERDKIVSHVVLLTMSCSLFSYIFCLLEQYCMC